MTVENKQTWTQLFHLRSENSTKLQKLHCFSSLLSPLATHVVEKKQTCPFTSVQNRSHPIFSHLIHEPFSENDNNSRYRHANSPLFERSETRIFISTSVVNKVYWQLSKCIYFVVLCLVATSLSDIDVSLENASDRGRVRAR